MAIHSTRHAFARSLRAATLVATTFALFGSPVLQADDSRTLRESTTVAAGQEVEIEFPVGELEVVATDGTELNATLEIRCRRHRGCAEALDRVALRLDASGRAVTVDIDGYPKWGKGKLEMTATIRVPRGHALEVEMGVGELEIAGIADNLSVELGVGEVDLELPESTLRSVSLEAGIGETRLRGTDGLGESRRSHLVGSTVSWNEGEGEARVSAEVGVGEVSARLTS